MSSIPQYVTDTTIWIDYFVDQDPNVKNWIRSVLSTNEGVFIISPVVLLEFAKRLYYVSGYSSSKIKLAIRLMTNIFRDVCFTNLDKHIVKEITRQMYQLPTNPRLDVGEISFLNLLNKPEVVVVSSDNDVLNALTFVTRIDPRKQPPTVLHPGDSLT